MHHWNVLLLKVTSPNTANQNEKNPPSSLCGFLVSRSGLSGGLCELLYARCICVDLFFLKECRMQRFRFFIASCSVNDILPQHPWRERLKKQQDES